MNHLMRASKIKQVWKSLVVKEGLIEARRGLTRPAVKKQSSWSECKNEPCYHGGLDKAHRGLARPVVIKGLIDAHRALFALMPSTSSIIFIILQVQTFQIQWGGEIISNRASSFKKMSRMSVVQGLIKSIVHFCELVLLPLVKIILKIRRNR